MPISGYSVLYTLPSDVTQGSRLTCDKTLSQIKTAVTNGYWLQVADSNGNHYGNVNIDWENNRAIFSTVHANSDNTGRCYYNNLTILHSVSNGIEYAVLDIQSSSYTQFGYAVPV